MAESLQTRILDAFPNGSYSLVAMLRILDIVETTAVPTAAVECVAQPRLLVNPEFVARHAATPEKLLVLVMHELHHVLLGHTTLFPRITRVQNFVFDAVVNGLVCRMFPRPEHTAFFRDYYSPDLFPECLLAPPPGWPNGTVRMAPGVRRLHARQAKRVHEVHVALYSQTGASYQEVHDLLPKLLLKPGRGKTSGTDLLADLPLLGNHAPEDASGHTLEKSSPVLFDLVREVVEQWPQPPTPIKGRSLADLLPPTLLQVRKPNQRARLRSLIRRVAEARNHGCLPRLATTPAVFQSAVPRLGRRSIVLRALGATTLLHDAESGVRRRTAKGALVHVYVDVSGSMDSVLPELYGAVVECQELLHPKVHLFSTMVVDITREQLRAGVRKSTFGTSIDCVAEHMAKNRVRRALLVTDGFVGAPLGEHLATLKRVRLAVAYVGRPVHRGDLAAVANHSIDL